MATAEQVKSIVHNATPALEKVLATDSLTSKIPESLQLRYSQCGLATAALQNYLLDEFNIPTERVINYLENAPRGHNFRILSHVALRTDNYMIDPTYSQFMNYVGLTHKTAVEHNLEGHYPRPQIMVYNINNSSAFADRFTDHAFEKDRTNVIPPQVVEYPPDGALRGKSYDEMQHTYQSIWHPDQYESFPVTDQVSGIQEAAQRISESMKKLLS